MAYAPPIDYSSSATAQSNAVQPGGTATGVAPKVFGGRPKVEAPWNFPYTQLSSLIPALPALNEQLSQNALREAQGRLSPEQVRNVQDYQANFGVDSGMPGSELATNLGARTIGTQTAALQEQGLRDYTNLIPTVFKTQILDPSEQVKIAMFNAKGAAEQDPFYKWLMSSGDSAGGGRSGGMGMLSGIASMAGI